MDKQTYRIILFFSIVAFASVYLLLFSESGILERKRLLGEIDSVQKKTNTIKQDNEQLRIQLNKYEKGNIGDNDLLHSGFIKEGDKIIFFRDTLPEKKNSISLPVNQRDMNMITVYRIAWLVFSFVSIAFLYRFLGKRIIQ